MKRIIFYLVIGILLYLIRPSSRFHKISISDLLPWHKAIIVFVAFVTCFMVAYPMTLNKVWNSSAEGGYDHHDQYQHMTDALLDGRLSLQYDDADEGLAELNNPYDPEERKEKGVTFKFDHAYYDGNYYMYFGVVPVVALFLPLRLLGIHLTECQATQIFSILTVLCFFTGLYVIGRERCKKMTLATLCGMGAAISCVSVWYAAGHAALYCTAITSGVCFALWGLFFAYLAYVRENVSLCKRVIYSFIAGSFGALVFGCRPTIGFASLLYVPMIVYHIKENRKNIITLPATGIPYVIVAILLMLYNYARFDNPFEFGQSYQLTVADQTAYSANSFRFVPIVSNILWSLISFDKLDVAFPHIHMYGSLILFPVLCIGFSCFPLFRKEKKNIDTIRGLCPTILFTVCLIIAFQSNWSPWLLRRYSLDYNFLLGILAIAGVCRLYDCSAENQVLSFKLTILSIWTCLTYVLLFFVSGDSSMTDVYPELLDRVTGFLLWK